MMTELWACGFNAWGQLSFEDVVEEEPKDLHSFKCILKDKHIEVLRTTLSQTLVKLYDSSTKVAGCIDQLAQRCIEGHDGSGFTRIAIAGNEKVAFCHPETEYIDQYNSLQEFFQGNPSQNLGHFENIIQLVANQTTFTALSKAGQVWTWGDGRYEACLGREVSDECPAGLPVMLEDLSDLPTGPIVKISSGGYVTAALTSGNDLYVWGGRPGQSKLLEDLSGVPMPVDLNGEDIFDISVGMDHMIALSTERRLFLVGFGGNGQLGLAEKYLSEWTEVILPMESRKRIFSVHAGYKNSYVVVKDFTEET